KFLGRWPPDGLSPPRLMPFAIWRASGLSAGSGYALGVRPCMSQIPSLPVDKPHQVNPVFPTWLCGFTLFLSVPALADDAKPLPASPQDLTALTLEQLLDVRV